MGFRWRMRFGLRTLLIAALVGPPLVAYLYRKWSDDHIWTALQLAKQRRDAALVAWREAYDAAESSKTTQAAQVETEAQKRYYADRQNVERAVKALYARYGNSEQNVVRAMQARRGGK